MAGAALTKKGLYLTNLAGTPPEKLCFLTLHKPTDLYSAASACVDWHVGAVPDLADPDEKKRKWSKIDTAWVTQNKAKFDHQLLWEFTDGGTHLAYLDLLADNVSAVLSGFTHEKRLDYCSGSDKTPTCLALVVRTLTKGLEGLGLKLDKGGIAQKLLGGPPALADIGSLAVQAQKAAPTVLDGNVHDGFESISVSEIPGPWGPAIKEKLFTWPPYPGRATTGYFDAADEFWATHRLLLSGPTAPASNPYAAAVAKIMADHKGELKDKAKGMRYVAEYGFRGDARLPILLRAAGGMFANATRDDRKALVDARHDGKAGTTPVLDHQSHQLKGDLNTDSSGYVSVSRSRYAAEKFINGDLKGNGFLYAVRVRSGIDVNGTWSNPPSPQECEISVPGAVPWEDIVGWRRITNRVLSGTLFLTKDAKLLPSETRKALKDGMSYKSR